MCISSNGRGTRGISLEIEDTRGRVSIGRIQINPGKARNKRIWGCAGCERDDDAGWDCGGETEGTAKGDAKNFSTKRNP